MPPHRNGAPHYFLREIKMSRSRKKNPGWGDGEKGNGRRYKKTEAARKVRYAEEAGNGGSYKKHFEQWGIVDYKYRLMYSNGIKKKIVTTDQNDLYDDEGKESKFAINYKYVRK